MKELLAKRKKEEERLYREAEEKIRKQEEAEEERKRKKAEEEMRKRFRKQREKERKERLRAEGKLLTDKQKKDRARANQMIEMMRQKGVEVPEVGVKPAQVVKKPRERMRKKQGPADCDAQSIEADAASVDKKEAHPEQPETEIAEATVAVVEAEKQEDDVKDAWDLSEDEQTQRAEETKPQSSVSDEEEDKEDVEEDEDDSEEEEGSSEEEDSEEIEEDDEAVRREKVLARIEKRKENNEAARTTDVLRCPVVCVLGHVDTGKTKILDKLRRTNVQDNEAGGITQQIGATNVPVTAIREQTMCIKDFTDFDLKLPGLLIIDTPGHESFSNLRSRGSSLCDMAILVVDIMHGLEPQTIESINLLKKKKCPFIIALNKIDRLFEFKSNPRQSVQQTLAAQAINTRLEFEERVSFVFSQMAEQSLNVALHYENKNPREYISMVPTSAHSGDGMGDLMALVCRYSQTGLAKRLAFSEELQAIVMEVKAITGLGTTVDVILVNGWMRAGQTLVLAGTEGPIVTQIRDLLLPQPMKELRVKGQYEHLKEVRAATGLKLIAKDLDNALAGLPLLIAQQPDEVDICKEEIAATIKEALASFKMEDRGVYVQASTLGSLEALLEFLRTSKIPFSNINIGPVHKKDVMKASVMLEHDPQMACILAFDVKVEKGAVEFADTLGVKIFTADIIYQLFDKFTAYVEDIKAQNKEKNRAHAIFPCKLKILPNSVFKSRDPIVVGVSVEAGFIKVGTPICVPAKENMEIGRVTSIEFNHKPVDIARKGTEVCIKIDPVGGEAPKMVGRHFEDTDLFVSKITRDSIDILKEYFRDEMQKPDWQLIVELKKVFQIL
jgi:translation initiation factor 5B